MQVNTVLNKSKLNNLDNHMIHIYIHKIVTTNAFYEARGKQPQLCTGSSLIMAFRHLINEKEDPFSAFVEHEYNSVSNFQMWMHCQDNRDPINLNGSICAGNVILPPSRN